MVPWVTLESTHRQPLLFPPFPQALSVTEKLRREYLQEYASNVWAAVSIQRFTRSLFAIRRNKQQAEAAKQQEGGPLPGALPSTPSEQAL